jgi:type IV pilus assembly protein PilA
MVSRRHEHGFTLIELLIVVAIIAIIAAIAIPGLLRARMASSETSAIETLRAIGTAQQIYAEHCHGYAPVLTELRAAGNYLSPDMTGAVTVAKSGYSVTITAGAGNQVLAVQSAGCTASGTNYFATAAPLSIGSTGTRGFAIDEKGAIWQDTTGVPPAQPFAPSGTISVIQ